MEKVFIIAEAGVNHNGKLDIALQLVDAAKAAGADAVKFQVFKSESLVSKSAKKAEYQMANDGMAGESQFEMLKKLELSFQDFEKIKKHCDTLDIMFLSTAFDFDSIDFLLKIDMPIFKIPSGEITNLPYLLRIAQTKKDVILSTGMSSLSEISEAIQALKTGGAKNISILHCTTEYPAPFNEVNLNVLKTLTEEFGLPIGYSDHTEGLEVSIAAVALGAKIIEKHFTLYKNMKGPDHKASIVPSELLALVKAIRNVEQSLGSFDKIPTLSELKNKEIARKSIVAAVPILKGDIFTENNITIKRPGNGLSPMKWFDVLGRSAICDFEEDEMITI